MSVNKVMIIGNLTADPDVKRMSSGDPVVNLSVATNERWKDKSTGERKERAEYHRVVIFNEGLAKLAEQYLKKGSKVYLEGQLQTRKWQDQNGVDKYTTEIVLQRYRGELTFLDSKPSGERQDNSGGDYQKQSGGAPRGVEQGGDFDGDNIPFAPWVW